MVSVSLPKRVKRVTRRSGSRKLDYERVAAASLALIGSLVFLWLVWQPTSSGNGYDQAGQRSGLKARLMNKLRPNHPDLRLQDPNSEAYNAIAQDIILTLDCSTLLAKSEEKSSAYSDPFRGDLAEGEGLAELSKEDPLTEKGEGPGGDGHLQRRLSSMHDDAGNFEQLLHRRLEGEAPGDAGGAPLDYEHDLGFDDYEPNGSGYDGGNYYAPLTAKHLFCLAAHAEVKVEPPTETKDGGTPIDWKARCHCNAQAPERQKALLDLWSDARSEMPQDVLLKALEMAKEQERMLVGHSLHLWAPVGDDGLEFMMNTLNQDKNADEGGIHGLENNLGQDKLFVDVGSCLGMTSMAVALLYPGTQIVSIEAASPNWLLQELNWRCNDEAIGSENIVKVILGGVGPQHQTGRGGGGNKLSSGAQMAKFTWRPSATTSARSWTPKSERKDDDVELTVKLRPWHALLTEAGISQNRIDVLNVDCEGCEYNLIPALTDSEFEAISTVMGSVHWGYIPPHKLPSSKRGQTTHERLCQHENIARLVKECCAFPDLTITSSTPGEVLVKDTKEFPPKSVTVKDVTGDLCDGFDDWAKEKHLYDIESDYGWFQITSMAD